MFLTTHNHQINNNFFYFFFFFLRSNSRLVKIAVFCLPFAKKKRKKRYSTTIVSALSRWKCVTVKQFISFPSSAKKSSSMGQKCRKKEKIAFAVLIFRRSVEKNEPTILSFSLFKSDYYICFQLVYHTIRRNKTRKKDFEKLANYVG